MTKSSIRSDGRGLDQVRTISFSKDVWGYADSSILLEVGMTKIFVAISLNVGVPSFLKGQGRGWLTAEYSMLPTSTHKRSVREINQPHRNFRSVEISRLIGRCLRTIIDLEKLGERTIVVDCDVLQADGGTRVAAITAASLALFFADKVWVQRGLVKESIFKKLIAAISVGVVEGEAMLDLSFEEDCGADADFNFIFAEDGSIIEIQGTAEKALINWKKFDELKKLAQKGAFSLFDLMKKFIRHKLRRDNSKMTTNAKGLNPQKLVKNYSLQRRRKAVSSFSLGSQLCGGDVD